MQESVTQEMINNCVDNYRFVVSRVEELSTELHLVKKPTIVAISKTKPASLVKAVYDAGHRDFGENYVQEICDKAPQLPDDIRWHFVGHLQSNKANKLCSVKNLAIVETVDRCF
eukprot:TRINITY_DN3398_c0_g1_i6.p1 TRINITY_DN3398_c0_g1~~TRINITY_DN3398_c0_g1_i6.p1  ORF type:complete len:114 (+),score=23.14 TRINITY_DN3398_c0_g1_i6:92-433(+)